MTFQTPQRPAGTCLDAFEAEVLRLMGLHQYAEAYLLLEKISNPSLSNLYNLALCLFLSEEYTDCLLILAKLEIRLPSYSLRHRDFSRLGRRVLHVQLNRDTYLNPVSETYTIHFPALLKESMLRLQIACYLHLRDWKRLIQVAEKLHFKSYTPVQQALKEAYKNLV